MEEVKYVEGDVTHEFKISAMDYIRCGGDINKLFTIKPQIIGESDLLFADAPASHFIKEMKVNGESVYKNDMYDINSKYIVQPKIERTNNMSKGKLRHLKKKK